MSRDFKKLKIFTLSYSFLLEVYAMSSNFSDIELKNIYFQLQRAATSIVLNIVKGSTINSNNVFFNHLTYSYDYSCEVEVLLMLAYDLNYIDKHLFFALQNNLEELKVSLCHFMKFLDKEIMLSKANFSLN